MSGYEPDDELSEFLKSGIYRFSEANVVFVDPVRLLNRSYARYRVSPSAYYSRFFHSFNSPTQNPQNPNKRKRSQKAKNKPRSLNMREQIADQRHQEVRITLLKAHESLLALPQLLEILSSLRNDCENYHGDSTDLDFVELGSVIQAPFFEIYLKVKEDGTLVENAGIEPNDERVFPVFDNLVINEARYEVEADLLDHKYILPKKSCFYMSDLKQIHNLIPAESDYGFNLIVIDPPWENGSAHQKLKYQTLPNRHFLSLPIKQLTHTEGAVVALWVTNREKLRSFVETELFPKWGVKHSKTFYWLKVKSDGSLISELDLFHHRPYECLLLGISDTKETYFVQLLRHVPDNQVFITVPGDFSRKPPIGDLLMDYVPCNKPARCIELFSRELMAGWTSWGNEPLRYQDSRYFLSRMDSGSM